MSRVFLMLTEETVGRAVDAVARYAKERQTASTDEIAGRIRSYAAEVDRMARAQEASVPGLLDSHHFRLSLGDLRARADRLAEALTLGAVSPRRIVAFLDSALELAFGGLRDSKSADDVADAVGRAIDDAEGFLIAHGAVSI